MLGIVITLVIAAMVAYMVLCETTYLFSRPTGCMRCGRGGCKGCWWGACMGCGRTQCRGCWPKPVVTVDPIEYTEANRDAITLADTLENKIHEHLPFSKFHRLPGVHTTSELIGGIPPPKNADPRVLNPSIAAAPVQFSNPAVFGTFGVTDNSSPAFGGRANAESNTESNAENASERSFEGFEGMDANGAMLVMDGKIVTKPSQLPSYQLKDYKHHTVLPMRSLHSPLPRVEDLVEADMFDGLQGYPIDEKGASLTPPGTAKPGSEWASIMYGYRRK